MSPGGGAAPSFPLFAEDETLTEIDDEAIPQPHGIPGGTRESRG